MGNIEKKIVRTGGQSILKKQTEKLTGGGLSGELDFGWDRKIATPHMLRVFL
jgi:hypothetical protein